MPSEVKGAWFVTARRFLESHDSPGALEQVLSRMAAEHRAVLADPLGSAWYPEAALQELLAALFETIAERDMVQFEDLMRRSTHEGIGRFFRMLISLGSFRFIMRNVPTMWRRIRRGMGKVEVHFEDEDRVAIVAYSEFPYFDDPLYRALTLGSLRGMAEVAAGEDVELSVDASGPDHLTVRARRS